MTDWAPLRAELLIWRTENLHLPLWWRDDDAIEPTPQLDQLQRLAEKCGLPVHLAIIPQTATPELKGALAPKTIPVVHGWAHQNHSPTGMKSAEFGQPRPGAEAELARGLRHLRRLYGTRVQAMFVPPWNRIDPNLHTVLTRAGYNTLSTYGPRKSGAGIALQNTHIDPIDWHGTRSLLDPEIILSRLVQTLQDRRQGRADARDPLGLLTHHLVHDPAIWDFCERVLSELSEAT